MRRSAAVTSVSWIPSEAIPGPMKLPFSIGVSHYDPPPDARLGDLAAWQAADRFRFANQLAAWIDVDDGQITGHGYSGGGLIGSTTLRLGRSSATFAAITYPNLQADPEVGDHTHELPFFRSGDEPEAEVRLLIPAQEKGSAEDLLAHAMSPPHFPMGRVSCAGSGPSTTSRRAPTTSKALP